MYLCTVIKRDYLRRPAGQGFNLWVMNFSNFSADKKGYKVYVSQVGEGNALGFSEFVSVVEWTNVSASDYAAKEVEAAYKRLEFHGLSCDDADYQKVEQSIRVWVAIQDAITHSAPSFIRHAVKVATAAGKLDFHLPLIEKAAAQIGYKI